MWLGFPSAIGPWVLPLGASSPRGMRSVWLPVLTGLCLAVIVLSSAGQQLTRRDGLHATSSRCLAFDLALAQRECPGPNPWQLQPPARFFPSSKCMLCAAVDLHKWGFGCLCVGICTSCSVWFGTSHCYWTCHPNKGWVIGHNWVRSWELGCQDWIADINTNVISGSKGFVCVFFFTISSLVFLNVSPTSCVLVKVLACACMCVGVFPCVFLSYALSQGFAPPSPDQRAHVHTCLSSVNLQKAVPAHCTWDTLAFGFSQHLQLFSSL